MSYRIAGRMVQALGAILGCLSCVTLFLWLSFNFRIAFLNHTLSTPWFVAWSAYACFLSWPAKRYCDIRAERRKPGKPEAALLYTAKILVVLGLIIALRLLLTPQIT